MPGGLVTKECLAGSGKERLQNSVVCSPPLCLSSAMSMLKVCYCFALPGERQSLEDTSKWYPGKTLAENWLPKKLAKTISGKTCLKVGKRKPFLGDFEGFLKTPPVAKKCLSQVLAADWQNWIILKSYLPMHIVEAIERYEDLVARDIAKEE